MTRTSPIVLPWGLYAWPQAASLSRLVADAGAAWWHQVGRTHPNACHHAATATRSPCGSHRRPTARHHVQALLHRLQLPRSLGSAMGRRLGAARTQSRAPS